MKREHKSYIFLQSFVLRADCAEITDRENCQLSAEYQYHFPSCVCVNLLACTIFSPLILNCLFYLLSNNKFVSLLSHKRKQNVVSVSGTHIPSKGNKNKTTGKKKFLVYIVDLMS